MALTAQDYLITNALGGGGVFLFLLTLNCMNAGNGDYSWFCLEIRAGIFKPLWSPGIDAQASIPPAYVAWRAGTITLFLLDA
jgi:hypothetical protein